MCGIAALAGKGFAERLPEDMLDIMRHRGPDARGSFRDQGVWLGHNRLAINDLSAKANQPFVVPDLPLAMVVNGEIYNFSILKEKLEAKGYRFFSHSDSEVILHGYLEFGPDIFPMLNGMFALALWDGRRDELILVRDRLGIKPLYYAFTREGFVAASELKAVAQCPHIFLDYDFQALSEYMMFEHCFSDRTLNKQIKIVLPGEIVMVHIPKLKMKKVRFWEPHFDQTIPKGQDPYQMYRELSAEAVQRHLISDVPLGCYLSGGIDSSTVSYWAGKADPRGFKTYTGTFGIKGYFDESDVAQQTADYFGWSNETVTIGPEDFIKNFQDICWHLDEPRAGMGAFPQYLVAQKAAEEIKVILTGHGGDELFGGYPVFRNLLAQKNLFKFFSQTPWRELILSLGYVLYPLLCKEAGFFLPVIYSRPFGRKILNADIAEIFSQIDPAEELTAIRRSSRSPYEELTRIYLLCYLPSLFMVEDKISMAFTLESRTPLCDNDLVDFALQLPLEDKLSGLELKHVPRQAMKGLLPENLFGLPKKGFPTPLRFWFNRELKTFVREYIADHLDQCPLFNKKEICALIDDILSFKAPYPFDEIRAHRIWELLCLIEHARIQKNRYH